VPETWAISGVDLHVDVTSTRVRSGLENALREAIRTGRLAAGTRVPSSRQLAADLGLARNTVADAYGQLVAEGWLTARQGSGTQVSHHPAVPPSSPAALRTERPPRYDLRAGVPNLASFPATAWVTALRRGLLAAPIDALGYCDPRGHLELREALAGYLARARGVLASPDHIVVCTGFTQGLALLSRVLHARGAATVATEAYGQPAHRHILAANGLGTRPLPVDDHGARVDQLTEADAAVLLTPAHQFPLGPSLGAARRGAAVAWATDTGGLIVEDDYDGEFRYDRHPIGALHGLAPDRVVYLGTASKTLAPGVRLGWLVAPPHLVDDLVETKRTADAHSSTLDQLALAQLLRGGAYDRHVRRCRHAYRRRRDHLGQAVRKHAPTVRLTGIAAGLHCLLLLPAGLDELAALEAAEWHQLALEGLDAYRHSGLPHRPALVIGYATPPDHAYTGALARLTAVLRGAT
jgi:GntR family transcriptional regulator/MocR family aminotransferase